MERTQPIVVVGAGFGGLAAALELALAGEQVVVVEKGAHVGGKASSAQVGNQSVPVGPTVLTMRWVFESLFERAGARLDDVGLSSSDILARHVFTDGSTLDLFADIERTAEAIKNFAGSEEADAYRRFHAYARAIASLVEQPFLLADRPSVSSMFSRAFREGAGALTKVDAHRSMARAIESYFRDPRLQQLFGRYATYVGSSPYETPATFNLIAAVEQSGVHIVKGGISRLAHAMRVLAEALGVTFRLSTQADRLHLERSRVSGVWVSDETGSSLLPARAGVANLDVTTLAAVARVPEVARTFQPVAPRRRSLSAMTWPIVAEIDSSRGAPELAVHTVLFGGDPKAEFDELFRQGAFPRDPTVYLCAHDRAEGTPSAAERLFAIVNAPAIGDEPLRLAELNRCEEAMMRRCEGLGVKLEHGAMRRVTPWDYEKQFPGTGGALYGEVAHGMLSPLRRQAARTKLPGLYLAGGSVHPGPGVPMAALSGCNAARAVVADLRSTARSETVFATSGL